MTRTQKFYIKLETENKAAFFSTQDSKTLCSHGMGDLEAPVINGAANNQRSSPAFLDGQDPKVSQAARDETSKFLRPGKAGNHKTNFPRYSRLNVRHSRKNKRKS